jgi:hypothetical protein
MNKQERGKWRIATVTLQFLHISTLPENKKWIYDQLLRKKAKLAKSVPPTHLSIHPYPTVLHYQNQKTTDPAVPRQVHPEDHDKAIIIIKINQFIAE